MQTLCKCKLPHGLWELVIGIFHFWHFIDQSINPKSLYTDNKDNCHRLVSNRSLWQQKTQDILITKFQSVICAHKSLRIPWRWKYIWCISIRLTYSSLQAKGNINNQVVAASIQLFKEWTIRRWMQLETHRLNWICLLEQVPVFSLF